jgi:hypothetical protein
LIRDGKTKDFGLNESKHSLNLIYSWFYHECHSDLLVLFSTTYLLLEVLNILRTEHHHHHHHHVCTKNLLWLTTLRLSDSAPEICTVTMYVCLYTKLLQSFISHLCRTESQRVMFHILKKISYLNSSCTFLEHWDSSVTRLRTGRPWFDSRQGLRIFSSSPRPDRLWGPPSLLSNGYRG